MGKERREVSVSMRRIYRRFERWRSKHPGARLPIPKALWTAAAKVAGEHGVGATAQILSLDYGKLKQMVQSERPARSAAGPPVFMELLGPSGGGVAECLIELEGPRGKMRVQWKGTTSPDLAGLSRALWERT